MTSALPHLAEPVHELMEEQELRGIGPPPTAGDLAELNGLPAPSGALAEWCREWQTWSVRKRMASVAIAVLIGTSGCHYGDGGWKAPAPGQAAVLLNIEDGPLGSPADQGFSDVGGSIAVGRDGSVYGMDRYLVRVRPDRTVQTVLDENQLGEGHDGLAVLPDGSLAFGSGTVVKRVTADQRVSVLAGAAGGSRRPVQAVPRSVNAAAFHFQRIPRPLGVRPDGSLIIGDGDVVWALSNGRLTRLYRLHKPYKAAKNLRLAPATAVDGEGTVYVAAAYETPKYDYMAHLGDVIMIRVDGTVGELALPPRAAGVAGGLASMNLLEMTGDSAGGVYIHTYDKQGGYIIHAHAGAAEVVARHLDKDRHRGGSRVPSHPVSAMNLPNVLPWNLAYRPGSLIMAGDPGGEGVDYILQIATK